MKAILLVFLRISDGMPDLLTYQISTTGHRSSLSDREEKVEELEEGAIQTLNQFLLRALNHCDETSWLIRDRWLYKARSPCQRGHLVVNSPLVSLKPFAPLLGHLLLPKPLLVNLHPSLPSTVSTSVSLRHHPPHKSKHEVLLTVP